MTSDVSVLTALAGTVVDNVEVPDGVDLHVLEWPLVALYVAQY